GRLRDPTRLYATRRMGKGQQGVQQHAPRTPQRTQPGDRRMSEVVQKLWGFCHTLRHDGVDYGDYIEQLTYLLFLKMADERGIDLASVAWQDEKGKHTTDCSWPTLAAKAGTALTDHYAEVLRILSRQPGLLGEIFT